MLSEDIRKLLSPAGLKLIDMLNEGKVDPEMHFHAGYGIEIQEDTTVLPNDLCIMYLESIFTNSLKKPVSKETERILEFFAEWLELTLATCSGRLWKKEEQDADLEDDPDDPIFEPCEICGKHCAPWECEGAI